MLTKNQILDAIKRTLISYKTNILDKEYSTKQYVDDNKFSGDYNDLINTPVKENFDLLINNETLSNDNLINDMLYKKLNYSCGLVEGNDYIVEITNLNTNYVYTQNITCISLPINEGISVKGLVFDFTFDEEEQFTFQFVDKAFVESFENGLIVYSENNSIISLYISSTSTASINRSYSVTIKKVSSIKKLDEKFLPDSIIRTMTLKLNADELNFIQSKVSDNYNNELEYITKRDMSFIISDNIETIIFEGFERYPYKVVGAYEGFNYNEHIVLERAISDLSDDFYKVHRIKITYSDDYNGCFLSSYYGDLAKINALTLNNTIEYIPETDYNPATKKYVDDIAETLVMKDTNKYKLITCDDPLVINKTDITDIADATVTIDNLTGQYGNLTANEDGTWTYTLNGFMNGLETFTFTVGETTQDLVIVPYKEMVYNDNNTGIVYNGTWDVENDTKYSNGSAHVSNKEGATATFTFTGTGVDVYSRTNPDFAGVIVARITGNKKDGTKVPAQTLIVDNKSESGDYYQIPTLSFDNLDYGTYKVKITVSVNSENNHSTYYLDGIRVYNPLDNMNLKINSLYKLKDKVNNVLYTDRGNSKFIPTKEYDPATKIYVDDKVASLVDSAPGTLDTLKELSTALGDDPNFATTMATTLGNKVDKVDGKALSTNDLTNELKANYDAAYAYSQAIHSYNDLTDKPDIPSIEGLATEEYVNNNKVTKTSELTNDSGYITSIPDEYITETELAAKNYIDNTTLEAKGYLTEHQDLSGYALRSDLHTHTNKAILDAITDAKITEWNSKSTFSGSYNDLTNKPTIPAAYTHPSTHPASMITGLATVATSGSYNDLTNKPTIPTVSNDLTNALKANYDAAYTHSQSAHAPSNAQKNSDITKAEIEAKLTGDVTTHTHSQYLTEHQSLTGYATEEFVNNRLSSLQIVPITQADYDALATKDPNILYLITTTNAGSIDNENNITLSSDLPSGRYTLKYEDENGQPLSEFDEITTMEV